MKKKYLFSMATALLLAVTGCSDDLEKGGSNQGKPLGSDGVYLKVNIMTPSSSNVGSRAGNTEDNVPTGGENGDGDLEAFDYENTVLSATIILYDGGDTNIDNVDINSRTAQIKAVEYHEIVPNQGPDDTYDKHSYFATVKLNSENLETGKPYRLLVVVNDDVTSAFKNANGEFVSGEALYTYLDAEIKNHRDSDAERGGFVMSTHQEKGVTKDSETKESKVTFTEDNKNGDTPAEATAWVERLSARIDYVGEGDHVFPVKDDDGNVKATVTIDAVAPINVATHNMYIFKRVSGLITDDGQYEDVNVGQADFKYLGDETALDASPHAGTNYVFEPTFSKTSLKTFAYKFGADYKSKFDTYATQLSKITGLPTSVADDKYQGRILTYAGENTMPRLAQTHQYSTGVIFRAKYVPKKVYTYNTVDGSLQEDDYAVGAGFYSVGTMVRNNVLSDDAILCADLIAAEANYIASGDDAPLADLRKNFTKADWFKEKTWAELNDLLTDATVGEINDLGYYAFLIGKIGTHTDSDGVVSTETINEDLSWSAFEETLEWENNVLQRGIGNKSAHHFADETCYYQYWIRHANNGQPGVMGIMEFCIVRNNVYQLSVTGVNGLGMPDPFDTNDTPDEGEDPKGYYLQVKLYVKDWVQRLNTGITLE